MSSATILTTGHYLMDIATVPTAQQESLLEYLMFGATYVCASTPVLPLLVTSQRKPLRMQPVRLASSTTQ